MADNPSPYNSSGYIDFDQWIKSPGQDLQGPIGNPLEMYDQLRSDLGITNTPDLLRGSRYMDALEGMPVNPEMLNKSAGIKGVPPQGVYNGTDFRYPKGVDPELSSMNTLFDVSQTVASLPQLARNDFKYVKPIPFGPGSDWHNATRYYNHPAYGRLGFDPFRDNESYYNTKGTALEDFGRSLSYVGSTFMAGIRSYQRADWEMPYLSDVETAKEFMEATSNSQSTRKNSFSNLALPFIGNTVNQYGLTAGMVAGYMLDLAQANFEYPGIGGGMARGARGAVKAGTTASKSKIMRPLYDTMRNQNSFLKSSKGPEFLKSIWNWTKRRGQATADALTPNTVNWIKNYKTADQLGEAAKLYKGFGAFYKDYTFAHMALAESEMEAGLVQYEWEKEMWDSFQAKEQRMPTMEEWQKVRLMSQDAALTTAKINFPVIYFSNLISLGGILKPIKPKMFMPEREIYRNAAGKVILNPKTASAEFVEKLALKDRITKFNLKPLYTPRAWGQGAWKFGKGFMKYSKANWVEGAQEIVQEITSDAVRDAYSHAYWADEADPEFGAVMHHAGMNAGKYVSPEGFEIFMSGFAMGGINNVLGAAKQAGGQGLQMSMNMDKYKAYKKREKKIAEEVKKNYNDYASNPFKYFDPNWKNYVAQKELAKDLEDAVELGDQKATVDIIDEQYQNQIATLLQTGKFDLATDYIRDMKKLSLEEFNEAYGTTFENDADRLAKLDSILAEAKNIKDNYEEITEMMPNKYNPYVYAPGTPEFEEEALMSLAHDEVVKSFVFSKSKLRRAVERYNKLADTMQNSEIFDHLDTSDISNLISPDSLDDEIMQLGNEIQVLEGKTKLTDPDGKPLKLTPEENRELKEKQEKRRLLESFKDASGRYFKSISEENTVYDIETKEMARYTPEQIKEQESALKDLEKAFTDYLKFVSPKARGTAADKELAKMKEAGYYITDDSTPNLPSKADMREAMIILKDLHELKADQKMFFSAVKYLSNPEAYADQIERHVTGLRNLYAVKQASIAKNLAAFTQKMEDSALASEIHALGYYLDEENLKALFVDGKMPSYIIRLEDGEILSRGDNEYEQVADIIRSFLQEVRNEGISIEEMDKIYADRKAKEKAAKTAEKEAAKAKAKETKSKKTKAAQPITMDNVKDWEDMNPGFYKKAMALFAEVNKERIANGMEPYASLEEMAKENNSKLRKLVKAENKTEDDIDAGEIDELRFYDESTIEGNLQKLQDLLKEHQLKIKTISSLTPEEREEFGVSENEHGYIVQTKKGKWVKAVSVTTEMGTNFDSSKGNRVRLPDGREGTITKKPKKKGKTFEWTIELDPIQPGTAEEVPAETIKLKTGQFTDITHEYSTVAGSTIDQLGRQLFLYNDPSYSDFTVSINGITYDIKERMSEAAFNKVKRELKKVRDQYADQGWVFVPTDVRLFMERTGKKPIAGELDLLLINNETGKIKILDFKTSKNSFKGESFTKEYTGLESGVTRSKKDQYTLQQSIYANLIENVTNAEVDSIGLIGLHINVNEEEMYIDDLQSADVIDLERDVDADEYLAPNFDAEDLGAPFAEADYVDDADVFDIVPRGDTEMVEALLENRKGFHLFTTLQDKILKSISRNPAQKRKIFTIGNDRWFRMFPLTVNQSENISGIVSLIETRIDSIKKQRKVLRPQFAEIDEVLNDNTLTKDQREGIVLALALGLPEEATGDYTLEIELADRKFYTNDTNVHKFISEQDPNKEMFIVIIEPYDRPRAGKVSKDNRVRFNNDMDYLSKEIEDATTFEELEELENEVIDRVNGERIEAAGDKKYITFATRRGTELQSRIADKRAELGVERGVAYDKIKAGHKLQLSEEFAEQKGLSTIVTVDSKKGTVVRVIDADGNEAGIAKVSFTKGRVVKVMTEDTKATEEPTLTPEEKANVKESNKTQQDFIKDKDAVRAAKDKVRNQDAQDVMNDFLDSLENRCE